MWLDIGTIEGDLSARAAGVDDAHVDLLIQCPDPMPPIVVHRPSMRVIDGLHRFHAAQRLGRGDIEAELFDGTEAEAFALSVHLNVRHGLPLAHDERNAAAVRILAMQPNWSDRFVAGIAGLSHRTIANLRQCSTGPDVQLNGRLGRDGKVRPLDPANRRLRAAGFLTENPHLSLRELAQAAQISLATARDVRLRVRDGLDPVPDRMRRRSQAQGPDDEMPSAGQRRQPEASVFAPVPTRQGHGTRPPSPHAGDQSAAFDPILQRLKKDPAIRFSESGRALIRHLVAAQFAVAHCGELLSVVPAHSLRTVAQIAQNNAAAWRRLAELVDEGFEVDRADLTGP
jgi:ParB-like chromosome segregation protein Spo0J